MSSKKQVHVVIDTNEASQNPEIVNLIIDHPEVESWETRRLPASDIEIEGIGFERKTMEDYASSIKGRLNEQTRKMGQRYEYAYILIDGDLSESESPFMSGMKGTSIRGHIASLIAREDSGVQSVIPCSDNFLLIDEAVRIARKHIEESDREFIPKPVEDPDVSVTAMMYASLPEVGPELANRLEDRWPTITEFIEEVDFETLNEIEGIGQKKAMKIIESIV